ncbi:MAG: hypothetical protein WAV04_03940 [Candidatus Microsaccharimonas sp.]
MNEVVELRRWHQRAQIDYKYHYMGLYAAFNAWYRLTTGAHNDREALNKLRMGNVTWEQYCRGRTMRELAQYMNMLVECTQREPISHTTPHWNGEVAHTKDWPSVVEYWYRVRCLVMHGAEIRSVYVYLAYETLNIFMTEVITQKHY